VSAAPRTIPWSPVYPIPHERRRRWATATTTRTTRSGPVAGSTSDATGGTRAKHAGIPHRRVRAVEGAGRLSLHPQGRPCGRPPAAAVLGRQHHDGGRGRATVAPDRVGSRNPGPRLCTASWPVGSGLAAAGKTLDRGRPPAPVGDLWFGGVEAQGELEAALAGGWQPVRLLSPELEPNAARVIRRRARRPCHPRATTEGQARSPADNHGQSHPAAELASRAAAA
jgi:hypothetical protein